MEFDPIEISTGWTTILEFIEKSFGKHPDGVEAVLFLIGVQELGKGRDNFTKEEKQDLMHIATCKVLSYFGFYKLDGQDQDGWPIWKLEKPLPSINLKEQEIILKASIIEYFNQEVF